MDNGGGVILYTCDMCQREVFESRAALARHVNSRHGAIVPDSGDLARLTEQLRPVFAEVLGTQGSKWRQWGSRTFAVSKQRDAGPQRLAEACDARRQLECVVRRWRPTAQVFMFGSSVAMGLWDGLSDIDFSVIDVDAMDAGEWPPNERQAVRGVANDLRRIGFSHPHLEAIEHARVPIIKHTAPSAFGKVLERKYEAVLSRSVRFLYDSLLDADEMAEVEAAVTATLIEASGGDPPERLWWDVVANRQTLGVTAPTTTSAVALLMAPPATKGALPDRPSRAPVASLPVHEELRPELFRIDFDLSFRAFGVRNSLLLQHYLTGHVCARPGALVLKDWSKSSGINNSMHGYLTSYAINILWIYFLVQKKLVQFKDPQSVPSSLQGTSPEPTYAPLIPADIAASSEAAARLYEQMGALLIEFFAFFTFTFDWERHVVSLNRPGITTKAMLYWGETNESTLGRGKSTRYDLCIEDPYEDNLNLGRHIGPVRSRKFHDEFRRALLSLVKGDFTDSCVFPGGGGAGAGTDAGGGDDGDAAATANSNNREPRLEDVTALLQVALDLIAADPHETTTTAALRAAFREHANDAFERVRNCWGWVQLTRGIGLRIVGDVVRPFRSVSVMRRQAITGVSTGGGGEANPEAAGAVVGAAAVAGQSSTSSTATAAMTSASPPQSQGSAAAAAAAPHAREHRKELDIASLDISDRVLATFLRELSIERIEMLPSWMQLSPAVASALTGAGGAVTGSGASGSDVAREPPGVTGAAVASASTVSTSHSDATHVALSATHRIMPLPPLVRRASGPAPQSANAWVCPAPAPAPLRRDQRMPALLAVRVAAPLSSASRSRHLLFSPSAWLRNLV